MDWLDRMNRALEYIEANLSGQIELEQAARIACCSPFHFQRMFSYIADLPLAEYIRRRRMSRAAADLQAGERVLDVALKYGYNSPTAFNRAFQAVHGLPPSRAGSEGAVVKAYPPISFQITIKGEVEMEYRIEKKPAIRIVGSKTSFTGGQAQGFAQIPGQWAQAAKAGLIPRLCALMDSEPKGILGVCSIADGQAFDYYIAVASAQPAPKDLFSFEIPAATWAIFDCVGPLPGAMQALQKRIFSEWLPTSGYEYASAPDIELYFEGDQSAAGYRSQVWLPVSKAKG